MSYPFSSRKNGEQNMLTIIARSRRLGPNRGADASLGGAPAAAQ